MGSISIEPFKPLDPENFAEESHKVVDFITNYYKKVEKYPVCSQVEPGYLQNHVAHSAPVLPESLQAILDDVEKCIIPGITHWQNPNFFAYFPANASTAGFLGEMLCSGINGVGFNWTTSPAATELEMIVIDWMGKLFKLPESFLFSGTGGGVIHGSTCEAVVCVIAAARDNVIKRLGYEIITKLVVYTSDETHFTVHKAAKLVGISPQNIRTIPTFSSTSYALSPNDLQIVMDKDVASGLIPLFLCATVGTTTCNAVDPIADLCRVAKKFDVWVHIDAAYAGSAMICPELRHFLDGVEHADSVSANQHKWFLTTMECCCLWLKRPHLLIESLSSDPEILKNKYSQLNKVVDYKDWQISLSRRFRALKLWIVLRRYGVANLMEHIRSDIDMAKHFEGLVRCDKRFEVVVERNFALVCFRLKANLGGLGDDDGLKLNMNLLEQVNSSGRTYLSHGVVGGNYVIRCAIGATTTEKSHIDGLWELIREKTDVLLSEINPS